ncbi:MAG TPA: LysM domain-containing protein, partial [Pirellulales bacterium]|nr:LysM domain-containing protein [Pirellulales bacterium]
MNTIKTLFLSALLSAAAYGVYVAVTGVSPINFRARPEPAKDWETGPQVVLSDDQGEEAAPSAAAPAGALATADLANGTPAEATPAQALTMPHNDADGLADPAFGHNGLAGMPNASPGLYASSDPYAGAQGDPAGQRYPPDNRYPPENHYPSTDTAQAPAAGGYGETPAVNAEGNIHAQFAALMQSAEASLAQGQLGDVHLELSAWYGEPRLSPDEEHQLTNLLDQLAGTVIYSRQHLLEPAYEVQPGDTLERIADDYQVPWQLLANINGLRDPQRLHQGEQLKVIRGPFHALVNLQKLELVLNVGRRYAGRFRIGIGGNQ